MTVRCSVQTDSSPAPLPEPWESFQWDYSSYSLVGKTGQKEVQRYTQVILLLLLRLLWLQNWEGCWLSLALKNSCVYQTFGWQGGYFSLFCLHLVVCHWERNVGQHRASDSLSMEIGPQILARESDDEDEMRCLVGKCAARCLEWSRDAARSLRPSLFPSSAPRPPRSFFPSPLFLSYKNEEWKIF